MAGKSKKPAKGDKSVINHDKYQYQRTRIKSDSGAVKTVVSNGDAVARALSYVGTKELDGLVRQHSLPKPKATLNAGLRKMSVANSLRALVRGGVPTQIGDYIVKSLDQRSPPFADLGGSTKTTKKAKAPAKEPAKAKLKKAA